MVWVYSVSSSVSPGAGVISSRLVASSVSTNAARGNKGKFDAGMLGARLVVFVLLSMYRLVFYYFTAF
jgi:hypothetical protein